MLITHNLIFRNSEECNAFIKIVLDGHFEGKFAFTRYGGTLVVSDRVFVRLDAAGALDSARTE